MCPTVDVDKVITLGLEAVNVSLVNRGGVLEVNSLPDPVNVRLLSAHLRTGQVTFVVISIIKLIVLMLGQYTGRFELCILQCND